MSFLEAQSYTQVTVSVHISHGGIPVLKHDCIFAQFRGFGPLDNRRKENFASIEISRTW